MYNNHFAIHLKPTELCKSIIVQLKERFKTRKYGKKKLSTYLGGRYLNVNFFLYIFLCLKNIS